MSDSHVKRRPRKDSKRAGTNRKRSGMKLRCAQTKMSLNRLREEAA